MKAQDIGIALAQKAAAGKQLQKMHAPLKVRADWVLEQIKQRENAKSVKELEQANYETWMTINPEWTKYGPELPLVARGSARADLVGALVPLEVASLAVTMGFVSMAYGAWKMWKGPKQNKKRYETFLVGGAVAWLAGQSQIPKSF